jgi:hypothetical protein
MNEASAKMTVPMYPNTLRSGPEICRAIELSEQTLTTWLFRGIVTPTRKGQRGGLHNNHLFNFKVALGLANAAAFQAVYGNIPGKAVKTLVAAMERKSDEEHDAGVPLGKNTVRMLLRELLLTTAAPATRGLSIVSSGNPDESSESVRRSGSSVGRKPLGNSSRRLCASSSNSQVRSVCASISRFLLSPSIVAKLQFSDLTVPIAEIAWKSLSKKALAKQLP